MKRNVRFLDECEIARGAELTPGEALQLAVHFARRLTRAPTRYAVFDVEDIAASALLDLIEGRVRLDSDAIRSGVLRASRLQSSRIRAERRVRARLAGASENDGQPGEIAPAESDELHAGAARRVFRDGTTAIANSNRSVTEPEQLIVILPSGAELRGSDAWRCAQEALLRDRGTAGRAQQTSNAQRAAAALTRDALLFSVAEMPWREALERLRQAGVTVSRDGLRSGLRAARLRCAGKAAHSRSRVHS